MHQLFSLKHLADLINPVLGVWLTVAIFTRKRPAQQSGEQNALLGCALAAIIVVYIVGHLNRKFHVWPAHLMFPSGHIAFSACIATCLCWIDRRTLLISVPVIAAQSVLIVHLGFHEWIDVFGALIIAPPLTWLCLAIGGTSSHRISQ